jgi:hypothetical protein
LCGFQSDLLSGGAARGANFLSKAFISRNSADRITREDLALLFK